MQKLSETFATKNIKEKSLIKEVIRKKRKYLRGAVNNENSNSS